VVVFFATKTRRQEENRKKKRREGRRKPDRKLQDQNMRVGRPTLMIRRTKARLVCS